jgi:hypothetical protein
METVLVPVAFLALAFWSLTTIVRVLSDNHTRRKAIAAQMPPQHLPALFARQHDGERRSALKWGIVLVSMGIGLMIVELIPFDEEGPFALGILAVAAGAGFLMYTTIAARMTEERPATQ